MGAFGVLGEAVGNIQDVAEHQCDPEGKAAPGKEEDLLRPRREVQAAAGRTCHHHKREWHDGRHYGNPEGRIRQYHPVGHAIRHAGALVQPVRDHIACSYGEDVPVRQACVARGGQHRAGQGVSDQAAEGGQGLLHVGVLGHRSDSAHQDRNVVVHHRPIALAKADAVLDVEVRQPLMECRTVEGPAPQDQHGGHTHETHRGNADELEAGEDLEEDGQQVGNVQRAYADEEHHGYEGGDEGHAFYRI
mmetsp:Transcript_35545/g.98373  ORF Transcript_35545/g.98373 Transcript_35545/m.98373 type:complete len:247 (+) Transcript_35545:469-1209(+)